MKIGIIGAMKVEADSFRALLENRRDTYISNICFSEGILASRDVVIAVSGVGKVFAAMCAQTMILKFGVDVIVNTGVAGALDDTLSVCDAVVADFVLQHDMDTTAIGDAPGLISGINIIDIPCDERVTDALEKSLGANRCIRAKIASGDIFVGDRAEKNRIREKFGAAACEMESGAIAQVCYVNEVPFGVLRVISDTEAMEYAQFVGIAAECAKRSVLNFLEIYGE